MLEIVVKKLNDLAPDEREAWCRIQQSAAAYDSPYFRPEFSLAVAAHRTDVRLAVLAEKGRPVGFFPYQTGRFGIGVPVGGRLSDFHGVIVEPGAEWNAAQLIRACGLRSWEFGHLIASQPQFASHHAAVADSPYMDLSNGFEAYVAERAASGTEGVRQTFRKLRKLEREVGPVRLLPHTTDPVVFDKLLDWKIQQYLATGFTNVLSFPWVRSVLSRIAHESHPHFEGMLSALYAGDHLVAVHFGMRSDKVLHAWFPAHDREWGKYSPGNILTVLLARECEALGVSRLDFGKGSEKFKLTFGNGSLKVAEGNVDVQPLVTFARRSFATTRSWVKNGPWREHAAKPVALFRRFREWLAFQ
jgi:CelD/BcsL family acetyltransferase involved in cellulose biosynthesis